MTRSLPSRSSRGGGEKQDALPSLPTTFLFLPPITMFSALVLVFSFAIVHPPSSLPHPTIRVKHSPSNFTENPPALQVLLADVADALDNNKVTFWLQPGLGLLPPKNLSFDGRLTPYHHGVDLAAYQSQLMRIVLAQTDLQPYGIVVVESFFGLRLFPLGGYQDDRYDFRTPFVDIVYMNEDKSQVVSGCCDCGNVMLSACTKKTCGCEVCSIKREKLFPLRDIRIEGIRRVLPGPVDLEQLMLPQNLEGVHKALFDL